MIGLLRFLMTALIAGCVATALAAGAGAQILEKKEPPSRSAVAAKIYPQLPPEDQERLVDEAMQVHDYCWTKKYFSLLHDCRCVATKAMEERIVNPDSGKSIITVGDEIAHECPNGPGAAGYAFEQCIGTYAGFMPYGADEFCHCYANTFSRFYMKDADSHIAHIRKVGSAALSACSKKPGMPNPFAR